MHSSSRSSVISRAKLRAPCTKKGSQSFTSSSKRILQKNQKSTKCSNQQALLSASTSPAPWLVELRRTKRGMLPSRIPFQVSIFSFHAQILYLTAAVELESKSMPNSPMGATFDQPRSPISPTSANGPEQDKQDKLSRLHDIFQYRTSTISTSSHGRSASALAPSNRSPPAA